MNLGGDVFADIRFDAEDDWPYMLTVGSRGASRPAGEHAARICQLMKGRGWDYEHTSGSQECAFCMGREVAHEGNGQERNPFTKTAEPGTDGWYESDYGRWLTGYQIGLAEAGRTPDIDSTQQ